VTNTGDYTMTAVNNRQDIMFGLVEPGAGGITDE